MGYKSDLDRTDALGAQRGAEMGQGLAADLPLHLGVLVHAMKGTLGSEYHICCHSTPLLW